MPKLEAEKYFALFFFLIFNFTINLKELYKYCMVLLCNNLGSKIFCIQTGILHSASLHAICLSSCRISFHHRLLHSSAMQYILILEIILQNTRYRAHRGPGCATSRIGAPAGWREGSIPLDTLRTIQMISTAPTYSLQPPVSRSDNLIKAANTHSSDWQYMFRSRLCLIISKSGQTTSIPTAVWEIGKLMGK